MIDVGFKDATIQYMEIKDLVMRESYTYYSVFGIIKIKKIRINKIISNIYYKEIHITSINGDVLIDNIIGTIKLEMHDTQSLYTRYINDNAVVKIEHSNRFTDYNRPNTVNFGNLRYIESEKYDGIDQYYKILWLSEDIIKSEDYYKFKVNMISKNTRIAEVDGIEEVDKVLKRNEALGEDHKLIIIIQERK